MTTGDICCVCQKSPVTQARNMGRFPSVTCGPECANMLNVSGSVGAAREKYKRVHRPDSAFHKFVYGK